MVYHPKKKFVSTWIILVMIAGSSLACSNFRTLNETERTHLLDEGKILTYLKEVSGTRLSIGESQAIVEAPPARVWNAITDYNHQAEVGPRTKRIEITRIEGDTTWVDLVLDAPWPLEDAAFTLKVKHDRKNLRTNWNLVEGNIKESYGSWNIDPFPGNPRRSLVTYTLLYDDGRPVPKWMMNMLTRSAVKQVIGILREHVHDPRYDKPVYSISVLEPADSPYDLANSPDKSDVQRQDELKFDEETRENLR